MQMKIRKEAEKKKCLKMKIFGGEEVGGAKGAGPDRNPPCHMAKARVRCRIS